MQGDTSVAATAIGDATLAAKAATSSMPINFVTRTDPMARGSDPAQTAPGGEGFARGIFDLGQKAVC